MKKVFLSFLLIIAVSAIGFAQETVEQRATKKADVLIKFIDVKFVAAPTKKLNGNQKKSVKAAYVAWETGKDSLKTRQANLQKNAADFKAKYDGKTLSEEQMAQQKAEQAALAAEQGALKTIPAELETKFDTDAKATLNAEQKKFFEDYRAAQKKPKAGSGS